jgi:hypothetical protein
MVRVHNGEMPLENGERIAVQRESVIKGYALFLRIEIPRAQETRPLRNGHGIHGCSRAFDAVGDMPDEDITAEDPLGSGAAFTQALKASGQRRP